MTINEAIKHAEEVAKEHEKLYKLCPVTDYGCEGDKHCKSMSYEYDGCLKCAEEHRQLAEWLKALKAVKDIIIQHDSDNMPEDFWYIDRIREEVSE